MRILEIPSRSTFMGMPGTILYRAQIQMATLRRRGTFCFLSSLPSLLDTILSLRQG
jgi:hypothetical protein